MKERPEIKRHEEPQEPSSQDAFAPEKQLRRETWDWFLQHQMEIRRAILQKLSKRLRKESRRCLT